MNAEEWSFLVNPSHVCSKAFSSAPTSPSLSSPNPAPLLEHGSQQQQHGDQRVDQGSSERGVGGGDQERRWSHPGLSSGKGKGQGKEQSGSAVRRDKEDDTYLGLRSKDAGDSMALYGQPCGGHRQQQVGPVAGMQKMQPTPGIYSGDQCTSNPVQGGSCAQCDGSAGAPSSSRMATLGSSGQHCQEHDQSGGLRESHNSSKQVRFEGHDQEEDKASGVRGGNSGGLRRILRSSASREEGGETEVEEHEWEESQQRLLNPVVKSLLVSNTAENYTIFEPSQAFRELKGTVETEHLWEICCSPQSTLSKEAQRQGFSATRWNWESGFDLGNRTKVEEMIKQIPRCKPTRVWGSPKCTAVTSIQNLNQRTVEQRLEWQKKFMRTRREVRHLIRIFKAAYSRNPGKVHIYMEWPKLAVKGWNLKEWRDFKKWLMQVHGQPIYFAEIHGCMFGLKDSQGTLINKPWLVMTTDYDFYISATMTCDGTHSHRQVIGMGTSAVHNTAFYPQRMVQRVVQIWKKQWHHVSSAELVQHAYQRNQTDAQFADAVETCHKFQDHYPTDLQDEGLDRMDEPQPQDLQEQVTAEKREQARSMLHKLHRAAGHPTNKNLARLCKDRRLPPWVIEEARNLKCQSCTESLRGSQKIIPRSLGDCARPWQFVAMDAFDLSFPAQRQKARYILFVCVATHFMAIAMTWKGEMSTTGTDSGQKVIDTFSNTWLMHRLRPQWVIMDSQRSFAQGIFPEFLEMAGIGSVVTAGEAHWQNGVAEAMINTAKRTMRRLRNEDMNMSPESVGCLAAYAHNHTDRCKGFSPIQWCYGVDPDASENPMDPLFWNKENMFGSKVFADLQRMRDKAEEINREERARTTTSRLLNAAPRPALKYEIGDHVCIWRSATLKARKRDETYNPEARFIGPGRVILIEPTVEPDRREGVIWVLFGARIYRCAPEQLRLATTAEVTMEMLKGTKITSTPKQDMIRLLKSYVDVTKEAQDVPPPMGTTHEDESMPPADSHEEWQEEMRRGTKRSGMPDEHENISPEERKKREVKELTRRWNQLVSVNNNRRREGLPPMMELPEVADRAPDELFPRQDPSASVHAIQMMEDENTVTTSSPGVLKTEDFLAIYRRLDKEVQEAIQNEIRKEYDYSQETALLIQKITDEKHEEHQLLSILQDEYDQGKSAWFIEFDLDQDSMNAFVANSTLYVKKVLESKGTEVRYDQLNSEQKSLFDEAKAREVSEVIQIDGFAAYHRGGREIGGATQGQTYSYEVGSYMETSSSTRTS